MSKEQYEDEMTEDEKELFLRASDNARTQGGEYKTLTELKAEWRPERFVSALGQVSHWFSNHPHPHSVSVMMTLLHE